MSFVYIHEASTPYYLQLYSCDILWIWLCVSNSVDKDTAQRVKNQRPALLLTFNLLCSMNYCFVSALLCFCHASVIFVNSYFTNISVRLTLNTLKYTEIYFSFISTKMSTYRTQFVNFKSNKNIFLIVLKYLLYVAFFFSNKYIIVTKYDHS